MAQTNPNSRSTAKRPRGTNPPEIVVYCEGFGAGPGCGWFVELSFLALNHGGFSVFRRSDGTIDDEWEEPVSVDGVVRAVRIATIEKPLTWRRALQFTRRMECIRVGRDDIASSRVTGVAPWQKDVITTTLSRNVTVQNLTSCFSAFADDDLQSMYERLGGLLSSRSQKVLPGLATALKKSGFRRWRLQRVADIVGVQDPGDLRALRKALESYR